MLATFGAAEPNYSSVVRFKTHDVQSHFPYHVAFQFHVECLNKTVKRTIIDEGVVTSVMSLYCWKCLGSPMLSKSMTMLSVFDGRSFRTHVIIPSLQVQFWGKTVSVEVEVVDAPLDYNLLPGWN